ncbi:hypothetical protein U1Q18_023487 [Sarracenia purpurea var. burkii]
MPPTPLENLSISNNFSSSIVIELKSSSTSLDLNSLKSPLCHWSFSGTLPRITPNLTEGHAFREAIEITV